MLRRGRQRGTGGDEGGDVTLEFSQWWEPELPDGAFRGLMDQFEEENPGIKVELLSGPYASTKEQVVAGAAAGTMSDVVGLDGAWVSDFADQGAITDLSAVMTEAGYDESQLASQVKVDDKTYMIPVVNFVYPMFTNDDLLAGGRGHRAAHQPHGVRGRGGQDHHATAPTAGSSRCRSRPPTASRTTSCPGSGRPVARCSTAGQPALTDNEDVTSATDYIQGMWDDGVIAPGSFTMKEQDKVEEFSNGRVGMMIDSLAHVNLIRESNPDLNFSISAIPAEDGYTGERGIPYASWGIGIAENSEHKAEAFKLVEFLMSESVNSELSSIANAFPGNTTSVPDFVEEDELFGTAFEIYQSGFPANEFTGLPVAEQLMRDFGEEFQKALDGQQSMQDALAAAQTKWEEEF